MAITFSEEDFQDTKPVFTEDDFQDTSIVKPRQPFGGEPFDTSPFSQSLNLPQTERDFPNPVIDVNRIPNLTLPYGPEPVPQPFQIETPDYTPKSMPGTDIPAVEPKIDVNKVSSIPVPSMEESAGKRFLMGEPAFPIEKEEVYPGDPKIVAAGKSIANMIAGLVEFPQTAEGAAAMVTGAAYPKAIAGLFTADAIKSLGQQAYTTYKNWDTFTPAQKTAAITDMAGTGAFAALLGKGALAKEGVKNDLIASGERSTHFETVRNAEKKLLGTDLGSAKLEELKISVGINSQRPSVRTSGDYGSDIRQAAAQERTRSSQERGQFGQPTGEFTSGISSGAQSNPPLTEEKINAQRIAKSKSVSQPTLRSSVGKSPPLRQSGEIATTQTPSSEASIKPGEPAQQTGQSSAPQQIAPEINQFSRDFIAGKKLSTEQAQQAGLQAKTIADLDVLAKARLDAAAELKDLRARVNQETDPVKQTELMNQMLSKNPQIPREAIESAINAGSHVEGELAVKLGERPLDWKNNPEVADWLKKNGEKLGIALPDELKASAPTAPATETGKVETIQKKTGQSRDEVLGQISAMFGGKLNKTHVEAILDNPNTEQAVRIAFQEHYSPQHWRNLAQEFGGTPEEVFNSSLARGIDIVNQAKRALAISSNAPAKATAPEAGKPVPIGELEPAPGVEAVGMGAATPGEATKPELSQLTDSLRSLAEGGKKPELKRAYTLSEQASQWKDSTSKALDGLKGVALYAKEKLRGMPVWDSFKNALGQRQLALTESTLNARDFADKAVRAVPKAIDREAIADWIDAGGDAAKLNEALLTTKDQYKKGYEKALNLTPEELTVARNIQNYFESRLKDAQEAGILEDGIEDYIHRIYEKDSPWKQGVLAELRSGVFTGKPALAKQRTFDYDFEAEQAGYKPIKDFAKRVAAYDLSLNKAIADRQFVKEAMQWKMPDGRPAIDAAGVGVPIKGAEGDAGPLLIKPQYKPGDTTNPKNNRSDYVALDHPALRKWKWVGEVAQDQPVLIQGNVLVHPDALPQIKAVFGKSKVRQNIVGRAALGLGATIKQTMLDLSAFHPVQITVHGWEHRTFKPVKEIDLQDPNQRALVSHGLVAADPRGLELFGEGLTGSSLTRHIPGLGPKLQAYNEWLFQDYIPRLKMAMAEHALERNRERFKSELASGKMTEDQVLHLTAMQGNAAFGELNYEMMARNKTTQDMLRLALLAPDFLEARGRFAGQAFTKYGKEQRQALLLGAATLYITARIINKLLDDQYHFEPKNAFSIVHNKHAYSLRTVQGDLLHMVTDPAKFAYNRLSPVYGRTGLEAITGRDAFGRSRTPLEQVKDLAKTIVPISLRGVVNPQEQKLWESFLNSIGVTERRETATDDIFKLAQDFKKKMGSTEPGEFIYDPEKDPYRSIKIAVAYETPEAAAQEMLDLIRSGKVDRQKLQAYVERFATQPFTGSHKNDRLFVEQLSKDQKKTYQDAIKERQRMKQNMRQAFIMLKNNL